MLSSSELGHQGLRVAPFHISSTHRATAFMEDRIPTDKMQGAPSFAETALRSTTLLSRQLNQPSCLLLSQAAGGQRLCRCGPLKQPTLLQHCQLNGALATVTCPCAHVV